MRAIIVPLALALALAACSGPNAGSTAPAGAIAAVPALDWRTAYENGAVRVELTDPGNHYRVEAIELVAPDGTRYRADQLTREVVRGGDDGYGSPSVGVGVGGGFGSWSGVGLGVGLGFPIMGGGRSVEPYTRTTTRIGVPDPARYGGGPAGWRIAARVSDAGGGASVAEFPAPAPGS